MMIPISLIQGIFRVIQGTLGAIQGTFCAIQRAFGALQGTFGVIQMMMMIISPSSQLRLWAPSSGVRDVFTATAYAFSYPRH
jgi:hypothetical protein